jgi:uncharacterized protein
VTVKLSHPLVDADLLWRLGAELTPLARFQQVPYRVPVRPFEVTASDGVRVAGSHHATGRRNVLVLCHGFGDHHRSAQIVWLADRLADRHDLIAFDWRGYGRSGGNASFGSAELRDLAAVVSYARGQGYTRVGVIGDSMGGLIALSAQAQLGIADAVATTGAPAAYELTGWPRPLLFEKLTPHALSRRVSRPLLGFRLGEVGAAPRPLDLVHRIEVPLLLLHGDRDLVVPVANARALAERAPEARLKIYSACGHAIGSMKRAHPQPLVDDLRQHFAPLV